MILLEKGNRILQETVSSIILREDEDKPKTEPGMDVKLCDFDDVNYRVVIEAGATSMKVHMNLPTWHDIEEFGGQEAFSTDFKGMECEADTGYHVAIEVKLDSLPEAEEDKENLVVLISTMKGRVFGGAFKFFLNALASGDEKTDAKKYDTRGDTTIYMVPKSGGLTVIFGVDFIEAVDKVLGKVFMQEFVDCQRRVNGAPPSKWHVEPPTELKENFDITENSGILGYMSFSVLPKHVNKPEKIENIVHVLQTFRSFLQYHIKMSKSYWHSKMRAKTQDLLKVLNRAKIEDPDADKKKKKTASGKTFKR